jgi:hypothetical protein
MKVGVICECSGTVRDAFIRRGHDAVSCDMKPTAVPGPHRQGDCFSFDWSGFDLLICHPTCTYLTCSAEWAYGDGPYHQKVKPGTLVGAARRQAREDAIEFVRRLWALPVDKMALENPVGVLSSRWMKPSQTIQPYQFGDDASKATCLWLRGLPKLIGTGDYPPRVVNGKRRWGNQTDSGQNRLSPGPERAADRSRTYQGIADAMADQWTRPFSLKGR